MFKSTILESDVKLSKTEQPIAITRFAEIAIGMFAFVLCMISFDDAYANTQEKFIRQDVGVLKQKVEEFLKVQSAGYAGEVNVTAGGIDPNLKIAACLTPEAFFPPGSRAWGKTSVGIQCDAPVRWKIYVQGNVSIKAQYLVASHPLSMGQIITKQDLSFAEGDLTQLPTGVMTDASQVLGLTARSSIMAGSVVRQDMLKQALAVQQGQTVLLTTAGVGFSINSEGKALKNANQGEVVSVKVQSGQVVSGIARADGKVEVRF